MVAHKPFNACRTMTLNLLLSLHMLLLVALLFGTLTSALIPARSPYTAIHAAAPIPTAKPIVNIKPRATAAPISSFTKSHKLRRQVQGFTCPPAVNGCKGAKDCLYPSPDRCNWFIQCDASGIAYTGACPMESMVFNDETKECDHSDACKEPQSE